MAEESLEEKMAFQRSMYKSVTVGMSADAVAEALRGLAQRSWAEASWGNNHEEAEDLVMQFLYDQRYVQIVEAWYATKKTCDFWYE
jgi:hypothetical protein